jgi:phage shock protein PspC (stress-responsive transcriptional regulator)
MEPTRKLYRSRTNRQLGGVCGGLTPYLNDVFHVNLDVTLVRVLFVVAAFFGGSGLIAYIVMWIVIPSEP